VDFARLGATIEFVTLDPGREYEVGGLRVRAKRQLHSGDSYGYRFEKDGKAVVYSTDSEHKRDHPAETDAFVEFFRDADLVIFDAMYSLADAVSVKEDWGHSSNIVGVELCQRARQRRRGDRGHPSRHAAPRGDHPPRRAAGGLRRLRRPGAGRLTGAGN
jgi:hypothetical protein